MTDPSNMARFWDERARENAEYFIDNRLDYRRGDYGADDPEDFWTKGAKDFHALLEGMGAPAIEPTDTVLDIGCGIGRHTRAAAAIARRVIGIDVSAEMIQRARLALGDVPGVELLVGDGTSLAGVADADVDVVVSFVVFQHIPDPQITLGYVREIGRVLRPGGWAAFQISNDPRIHRTDFARASLATRLLGRLRGTLPRGQQDPEWRGSAIDLADLRAAAADAGTTVERVSGQGEQFCLVLLRRGS